MVGAATAIMQQKGQGQGNCTPTDRRTGYRSVVEVFLQALFTECYYVSGTVLVLGTYMSLLTGNLHFSRKKDSQ